MSTSFKTAVVFIGILLCLVVAGTFPTPNVLGIVLLIGSGLILYQMYMVLTDDYVSRGETDGPAPGYRKTK